MKSKKDENSKQRILSAATKLFAEKGFDGTSVREICKEAGVNLCMISYYWGGKQELYNGITEDLIERQTAYSQQYINFDKSPYDMSKQEQYDTMIQFIDRAVDFFYSNVSGDLIKLIIGRQNDPAFVVKSQSFEYIRTLLGALLNKDKNDKEVIFKMSFIIAQINSPRIMPVFSLKLLGQEECSQEDINIIKENVKFYINAIIKEANN